MGKFARRNGSFVGSKLAPVSKGKTNRGGHTAESLRALRWGPSVPVSPSSDSSPPHPNCQLAWSAGASSSNRNPRSLISHSFELLANRQAWSTTWEAKSHDARSSKTQNARITSGEPLVSIVYRAVSGSGRRNGFILSLSTPEQQPHFCKCIISVKFDASETSQLPQV